MNKHDKQSIQEKLQKRTPVSLRQVIKPVDMLGSEHEQQHEQPTERIDERTNERPSDQTIERSKERTIEGTNDLSNERTKERKRVRHSFDIYQDQLLALKEIAISREQTQGKRILLGELVQEALDHFITNERSSERMNERTNE